LDNIQKRFIRRLTPFTDRFPTSHHLSSRSM